MAMQLLIFFLLIALCVADAMRFQGSEIGRPFLLNRRALSAPTNVQQTGAVEDASKVTGLGEKESNKAKQTLPENFLPEDVEVNPQYWPVTGLQERSAESDGFDLTPIVDGKILEFIGEFFSDEIKQEANRDKAEMDKLREKELYEKYNGMLNDPEKLKVLQEEAKNSPKYINQVVRRSFVPAWQPQGRSSNQYVLQ